MADEEQQNGGEEEVEQQEEQSEEQTEEQTEEQAPNPISEDDRKLFVGGLPQEAKDTDIKEYFGETLLNVSESSVFTFIIIPVITPTPQASTEISTTST